MKCLKCGTENKKASKFCNHCGASLSTPSPSAPAKAVPSSPEPSVPFWRPDWRWHLRALLAIYAGLAVIYFGLSLFLSKVPEPYRMRDIPQEMTPWLKR